MIRKKEKKLLILTDIQPKSSVFIPLISNISTTADTKY